MTTYRNTTGVDYAQKGTCFFVIKSGNRFYLHWKWKLKKWVCHSIDRTRSTGYTTI